MFVSKDTSPICRFSHCTRNKADFGSNMGNTIQDMHQNPSHSHFLSANQINECTQYKRTHIHTHAMHISHSTAQELWIGSQLWIVGTEFMIHLKFCSKWVMIWDILYAFRFHFIDWKNSEQWIQTKYIMVSVSDGQKNTTSKCRQNENKTSASGNRTPATAVKARDPNHWTNADFLEKRKKQDPVSCWVEVANRKQFKKGSTQCGARTHDIEIKSLTLYRLS